MKFAVGDTVRLLRGIPETRARGSVGTVVAIHSESIYPLDVEWAYSPGAFPAPLGEWEVEPAEVQEG